MKIKIGVTRIVIILNTVVIKLPNFTYCWDHFLRGIIGNISENQTWKWNSGKFENGNSHLLCPVLWCSWGGWILVMQKADTNGSKAFLWSFMNKIDQHKKHFGGDDTTANYGMLNDRIVKIDYAELNDKWGEDFKPIQKPD